MKVKHFRKTYQTYSKVVLEKVQKSRKKVIYKKKTHTESIEQEIIT